MHQSMNWKGTVILNNVFVPARCLSKVFWLDQDAKQDMHIQERLIYVYCLVNQTSLTLNDIVMTHQKVI